MSILITDTTLRDAHQSLIATRMRTRDMLPIVEELDKVGFSSLEVWGGATFDACIRYLNEDPWDRLQQLKSKIKHTKLQMLLRGQNLVGYRHYPDDVLREFVRLSAKNGIDIFRIFDALNDIRNMEPAISTVKEFGGHAQGTICYTTSPVHTTQSFVDMAGILEKHGCDSICVKDMAGLISPTETTTLFKALKKQITIPISFHSHCSSGMAPSSYLAAAEVGVDMLDTAFSAFGWGTSQPPTESIVALLRGTPYDSGLDLELLYEIGEYFAGISAKYRMLFTAEATRPNVNVLLHQIPGGMLSNLVSQLREQNALERKGEVLSEIPKVRKDFGYPPLVTPTSQLVGTQAVLNVLDGVRYKQVTQEVRDYFLGKYGRPPAQLDEEVKKLIVGDERPINGRPADLLEPGLDKARDDAHKFGIMSREEDLLTYALYPRIAVRFLKGEMKEEAMPSPITSSPTNSQLDILPNEFNVDVDGEVFNVKVSSVIGKTFEVEKPKQVKEIPIGAVVSSMQGMVLSLNVKVGDTVKVDDALFSIEAMKMQNEIKSPHAGTVKEVLIYEGEVINAGDVLMVIES